MTNRNQIPTLGVMQTVSFICVNFNNSQYTEKFCESLSAQSGRGEVFLVRCLVVDNSTDETDSARLKAICRKYEWIQYISSDRNLGYFGGLSRGLAQRPQEHSRFVVLCNNDLEFDPSFCRELLALAKDPRAFAICPDVVTLDGKHQNPHLLERVRVFRRFQFDLFFSHFYVACVLSFIRRLFLRLSVATLPSIQERREIHMGIGACYVLTENYFSHFDNLDCPVFLYGEEVFMSAQIHSKGGVLIYEPRLRVNHAGRAALSRIPRRVAYEYERKSYPQYRNLLFGNVERGNRD